MSEPDVGLWFKVSIEMEDMDDLWLDVPGYLRHVADMVEYGNAKEGAVRDPDGVKTGYFEVVEVL